MLTFVELRDARPESLLEAAEAWDSRARLVSMAVRALDHEVVEQLKDWSGAASRAAVAKLTRAAARLAGACTVMFGMARELADISKLIGRAQGDLQDAIGFAHSKGLEVENDGSVLWRPCSGIGWITPGLYTILMFATCSSSYLLSKNELIVSWRTMRVGVSSTRAGRAHAPMNMKASITTMR